MDANSLPVCDSLAAGLAADAVTGQRAQRLLNQSIVIVCSVYCVLYLLRLLEAAISVLSFCVHSVANLEICDGGGKEGQRHENQDRKATSLSSLGRGFE